MRRCFSCMKENSIMHRSFMEVAGMRCLATWIITIRINAESRAFAVQYSGIRVHVLACSPDIHLLDRKQDLSEAMKER